MNVVIEQYLWPDVNYLQDDWSEWLLLAECAANNQASETTGSSPFFTNKGFNPRYEFDLSLVVTNDINDQ
jgi:hypothetical protein